MTPKDKSADITPDEMLRDWQAEEFNRENAYELQVYLDGTLYVNMAELSWDIDEETDEYIDAWTYYVYEWDYAERSWECVYDCDYSGYVSAMAVLDDLRTGDDDGDRGLIIPISRLACRRVNLDGESGREPRCFSDAEIKGAILSYLGEDGYRRAAEYLDGYIKAAELSDEASRPPMAPMPPRPNVTGKKL